MLDVKWYQKNPYYRFEIALLIAGILLPFSFAPYGLFWLQFPLLAFLFLSCLSQPPKITFRRGFIFALGSFAHGMHWVYYSLHVHSGMPMVVAFITIVLLAAYMSLFPALSLYLANRFFKSSHLITLSLVFPASWMIFEWLRGYVLTGIPWMQLGTAHIDTYLAGYGPLIGGLGMGLMVMVIVGLLAASLISIRHKKVLKITLPAIFIIYLCGFLLNLMDWTHAVGEPIKVSLIQGNIEQKAKWKRDNKVPTLKMYRELSRQNWASDLIIWPETAVPAFKSRITGYLNRLSQEAHKHNTEILLGLFMRDNETQRYYNSVITLDGQYYQKRHLVPLGEYFPLRPLLGFITQWVNIPMSDIDSGDENQSLIKAAGQVISVSICFEDVFDRDILRDLPEATLLVNVSNDAWFEDSPEPWQHHQIARIRALETGRVLLRATNTGVTSVIGPKGQVMQRLPQFERSVLNAKILGYQGTTPYVLWGNKLMIIIALAGLFYFYRKKV